MHRIRSLKKFLLHNTSTKQTVVKNTFWLLIGDVSYKLFQATLTFFLAYSIGKEQFGIYSYITSVIGSLIMIVDFNLIQTSIRSVKQSFLSINETIKASMQLKILLSAFGLIIVFLIPNTGGFVSLLLLYYGYCLFSNSAAYLRSWYRHDETMEKESLLKIISGCIMFLVSGGILLTTKSLTYFVGGLFIAGFIDFLITRFFINKKQLLLGLVTPDINTIRKLFQYGFPLAISSFLVSLYINADQILLGYYGQHEGLGIYAFAYKITLLFTTFSGALFAAIFPKSNSTITLENSKKIYLSGINTLVSRNSLLVVLLMMSTYILDLYGGNSLGEYTQALSVLQILRLYCLLEPLGHWGYTVLISLKKDTINLLFLAITAFINIVGNIIFIPQYGYIASAWTTVFSYFIYTVFCFIFINQGLQTMSKE